MKDDFFASYYKQMVKSFKIGKYTFELWKDVKDDQETIDQINSMES